MPKWIRKTFVALVTLLTFGMVTPYQTIHATNEPIKNRDNDEVFETQKNEQDPSFDYELTNDKEVVSVRDQFLNHAIEIAESQSILKFGDRIAPLIENEFQQIILPKMEAAIQDVTAFFGDEDLDFLVISEKPGKGQSEKIFHIYNEKTGKDVIRFHVRRDLRPLEGYWFNFHYHTFHDHFQAHYTLGDIFWDKNTPPNWMN